MTPPPLPTSSHPDMAYLAERSEMNAYESLAKPGAALRLERFGSAVALWSPEVSDTLNLNRVLGLGLDDPASPEILDAIAALYARRQRSFGVEVGSWARPAELVTWLKARRMRRVFDTALYVKGLSGTVEPSRYATVRRAATPAECDQAARICCTVFRMAPPVVALLAGLQDDSRWRHWLVFDGERPLAAALSFVDRDTAWLGWDATLPEARGRGLHAALIAARIDEARRAGCVFATSETAVDTSARTDPSGANYRKLGFVLACRRSTYVAMLPRMTTPSGIA